MITKVIMPKLGETMEDGIISKWLKRESERVEKGEPLFEVTTDKANFEVESLVSGFLRKILSPADNDNKIPVIQTIAYISDTMEEEIPKTQIIQIEPQITQIEPQITQIKEDRIKASPLAKKLAKEKGIDLSLIKGTGSGGRITEDDVLKASVGQKTSAAVAGENIEIIILSPMRKTIAQRLSQSKHDVPHYYLEMEIDMTEAEKLREEKNKNFSYTDLIIILVAKCLKEFPLLNATFQGDKIKVYKDINIGMALATEKGLIVPVIKQANKKSLAEITGQTNEFKEKAKSDKFQESDFSNCTFTISNLGMYGVDMFTAIINPPQTGILAIGQIKPTPTAIDDKIVIRPIMKVTLSCDHRAVDGVYAAKFLGKLRELLTFTDPAELIEIRYKKMNKVLFLGNSITLHNPKPEIGWYDDWGMAASSEENDYAHLILQFLTKASGKQPQSIITNIVAFEQNFETYDIDVNLKKDIAFKPDLVIVAIGENVPELTSGQAKIAFKSSMDNLLGKLKAASEPTIVVRSCFWPNPVKNAIMKQACDEVGGIFVDAGLGKDDRNFARSERQFSNKDVADHPGDRGMRAIADIILKSLGMFGKSEKDGEMR